MSRRTVRSRVSDAGWERSSAVFESNRRVFCRSLRLNLVESLTRIAERVYAGRHAAIDRDLQQDFLDLFLGKAVLQGALDVKLQLMRPIESAEHRQVDDRTGALVEPGSRPQRAPAELGRPFRHGPREFVSARDRFIDIVLAEHFLANLKAFFEQLTFAHDRPFRVEVFLRMSLLAPGLGRDQLPPLPAPDRQPNPIAVAAGRN